MNGNETLSYYVRLNEATSYPTLESRLVDITNFHMDEGFASTKKTLGK